MEVTAHIDALRAEGELMAAAVDACDPGAPVPTCPEWAVRDLVRHMGGVHRWATGYVAGARTEMGGPGLDEIVGAGPADAALADWLRHGCSALTAALTAAPTDLECWTFLPAPSPLAMWARRQTHETAIHRVDAELAAVNAVHPFAPPFAADGVDELLTCFVPRRSTKLRAEQPATMAVHCTDDAAAWVLRVGPHGVTIEPERQKSSLADCTARGPAADLYLALWNRPSQGALSVEGNRSVLDLFADSVHIRWS